MADNFDYAYIHLLFEEGFYTTAPNETVYGIDRKESPNWDGWKLVDAYHGRLNFPDCMKDDQAIKDSAKAYTRAMYWKDANIDLIQDDILSLKLLDISYNQGKESMLKNLNQAMMMRSHYGKKFVYVGSDVSISQAMATQINKENSVYLLNMIRILDGQKYMDLVILHPDEFLVDMDGWFARSLK